MLHHARGPSSWAAALAVSEVAADTSGLWFFNSCAEAGAQDGRILGMDVALEKNCWILHSLSKILMIFQRRDNSKLSAP